MTGFSLYSEKNSKILNCLNKLRDTGADAELDLPTLIISGNQSSGKSSLIEALCNIQLPRAAGTCTRSVTQVRLSKSNQPWTASVKLLRDFDSDGKALKTTSQLALVSDISTPSDVEIWVKRAQKALLNPSTPHSKYITCSTDDLNSLNDELKFTRNSVVLQISGADVDLTLIDLPGIIRNVDKKSDSLYIDLIQDLVMSYISKDRAIIVATISCKDEIENQAIVQLAKQVDPYGSRTIGVLTKPDTIEQGTHDKWVALLQGNQYALKLGYWMVKCPSQADLDSGITSQQAKSMESDFFNKTKPWNGILRSNERFGIDALRVELSKQLTFLADASIPDLKLKAEQAINQNTKELSTVAAAVSENPRIELLHLIRHFCSIVSYNVVANQEFKTFYQKIRAHFEDFKSSLNSTKPVFSMADAIDKNQKGSQSLLSSTISSTISSVMPSGWISNDEPKKVPSPKSHKHSSQAEKLNLDIHKPISISDLRKIIDSQKGREIQGYSPYGAFTHVIQAYQEDWSKLSNNLMKNINNELQSLVLKISQDVFGRFFHLSSQVRLLLLAYLNDLSKKTLENLSNLVVMERKFPFTMGSEEFNIMRMNALGDFKSQLESIKNNGYGNKTETINKALAALAEAGYTGLTPRDLAKLKESPLEDEALQVMAGTDAYFRLAIKRFGDNIPMSIDFFYLSKCSESLEKELVTKLGILDKGVDALSVMLSEDRTVVERRAFLLAQRNRLETIWKLLHEI